MTTQRDPDVTIAAWLDDGPNTLPPITRQVVVSSIHVTPQRRKPLVWLPWRFPDMTTPVRVGMAAVIGVLLLGAGIYLFGGRSPGIGGAPPTASPSPTAAPTPEPSAAEPTTWSGLPEGPFVVTGADDPVRIGLDIVSSGWSHEPERDYVSKNDDGLDPPESVGVMLIAWAWPAGTGFNVYGDPCHWTTTIPATPATTPDEIAADFAAQAMRDATAPVDVTVGGYAGKAITLHTPLSYHQQPDVGREEEFADCDNNIFAQYGLEGDETVDARNAQGPGQIDELWILDVNGSIVILDAAYGPAASADLVEELRTLAESATFEAP